MTSAVVCAKGVELLMEYLEGALPAELRSDLESHLAGCPRCVAFVASYSATPRILREATDVALPGQVARALAEFLRRRRP